MTDLDSPGAPRVVDLRNPPEWAISRMPGALEIPLPELESRLEELDPESSYVLTCQKGPRALKAYALLKARGYRAVRVLEGGMEAWAAAPEDGSD